MTYSDILAELHAKQYRPVYYLMGDEPYFMVVSSNYGIVDGVTPEE